MNCENKELFRNYCIVNLYCGPQFFRVQHWLKAKRTQTNKCCFGFVFDPKFLITSPVTGTFPLFVSQSPFLPHTRLCFFCSLAVTLKVFLTGVCSVLLFSPPRLLLFSLAGSVGLPRDGPVLCSRYRPIDFGRERKYCEHDSPCMNLMIPVLSVASFQWRRKKINHKPLLSPSLQACQ